MPLPGYLLCIGNENHPNNRENLIVEYHAQGFTNFEILSFLRIHHNITISISTLKRILATLLSEIFAGRKFRGFAVFLENREIKFREIPSFFANRENKLSK